MLSTAEMRWFRVGSIPADVLAWFLLTPPEPEDQPARTDYYLGLRDTDSLGIKLREGRIEIKQRHQQYGIIAVSAHVTGRAEGWRKWTFELADAEHTLRNIDFEAHHWIPVAKERKLKSFDVTEGHATQVSAQVPTRDGCNFELVHIKAAGTEWWSLAFEAFGRESGLYQTLMLVVNHVFSAEESPRVVQQDSFSYPKWLQMVQRSVR